MKTNVRATSIQAFADIIPELGERQMQVLKGLKSFQPCSNLMLSRFLRLPINQVVPRIYELRKMGIVVIAKKDIDPITQKKVIFWNIKKWLQEIMKE
jgi:hypothetical protein